MAFPHRIAATAIVVLIVLVGCKDTDAPTSGTQAADTLSKLARSIEEKDKSAALALTSDDFRDDLGRTIDSIVLIDGMAPRVAEAFRSAKLVDDGPGWQVYESTLVFPDGQSVVDTFKLVQREDGQWVLHQW